MTAEAAEALLAGWGIRAEVHVETIGVNNTTWKGEGRGLRDTTGQISVKRRGKRNCTNRGSRSRRPGHSSVYKIVTDYPKKSCSRKLGISRFVDRLYRERQA